MLLFWTLLPAQRNASHILFASRRVLTSDAACSANNISLLRGPTLGLRPVTGWQRSPQAAGRVTMPGLTSSSSRIAPRRVGQTRKSLMQKDVPQLLDVNSLSSLPYCRRTTRAASTSAKAENRQPPRSKCPLELRDVPRRGMEQRPRPNASGLLASPAAFAIAPPSGRPDRAIAGDSLPRHSLARLRSFQLPRLTSVER